MRATNLFLRCWWLWIIAGVVQGGCGGRTLEHSWPVSLQLINAESLKQAIADYHGQVVLVDFWATWCGPCVELYPHTVELFRRYGEQGLAVITVSLDGPDSEAAIRRFLARQGPVSRHFLASYEAHSEAFTAFGIKGGALPYLRLYDQQGNLRRTFSAAAAGVDAEEIEHAIQELLAAAIPKPAD